MSKRIDRNLDQLIVSLKITKPSYIESLSVKPQKNSNKQIQVKSTQIQQDSVVFDNYDDLNCYSFQEVNPIEKASNVQSDQFSFCQDFSKNNTISNSLDQDSLSKFSSIVDKLKTQGDFPQTQQNHYFYLNYIYEQSNTERLPVNHQFYCNQIQQSNRLTQRRHTEYFSDKLAGIKKSYKQIAQKSNDYNFSKSKKQPIYAKLNLHNEKQNIQKNSNMQKTTLVSMTSNCKNSNYSSAKKKPFAAGKTVAKLENCYSYKKVKQLNQKIRKQNQIVYQSQFKQKSTEVDKNTGNSLLKTFKNSSIQPHKFSSYKVKLFC